ncbi:hypothetical protein Cfla_0092 [Cellulomonas flavigena DSM 20109]|uniref:Uncharacterized protein n=1 Tax=Cellulomonas flavigena (strain ATCC 482 / DSM 20109 / BCRC 11376 / JCM 18109 / NBRC 3775 / NCIMB 8073 / NRS 134) TaxID=446466 RepID=D5UFQ3_CELFN|nr:hypothetical protein Cfla_0092 [Cellulomonas flavigena DSM 20109]
MPGRALRGASAVVACSTLAARTVVEAVLHSLGPSSRRCADPPHVSPCGTDPFGGHMR